MSRLLYISNSKIPSHEANSVHVANICNSLANYKDVILYCFSNIGSDELKRIYGVENYFEIFSPLTANRSRLARIGQAIAALFQLRRKPKFDCIIARDRLAVLIVSMYYSKIPFLFDAHSMPVGKMGRFIERALFSRPNFRHLTVTSQRMKQDYIEVYPNLKPSKIKVLPNGASPKKIVELKDEVSLKGREEALNLGYAGRLIRGKGLGIVIDLAHRNPDMNFHVFGGSESEIEYWKSKSSANTFFYGHVKHSNLLGIFRKIDIFLAPIQEKMLLNNHGVDIGRWTSPIKVFEYMASQRPIIASDSENLKGILVHEENCILCKSDDVDDWARAVRRLAEDPALRARLAEAAYQDFLENFTWDARAQKMLSLVDPEFGIASTTDN